MTATAVEDHVHQRLLTEPGLRPDHTTVVELVRDAAPLLAPDAAAELVARVIARVSGLGSLDPLLEDPDVNEVMVNGPGAVWVERAGRLVRTNVQLTKAEIEHLLERVVAPLGLRIDRSLPIVDARLPDGSRVNAVVPPLAVDGPYVTIRRFSRRPMGLDQFCSPSVAALLRWSVKARLNVVVCGGTGAGKTSLLNALGAEIPLSERVITIEDAAELQLRQPHVLRLEARPANAEGKGAITVRTLVRNALRMRPDRIIVGEVRGGETLDMLQALNTGHEGSLSTCHANGPADALRRLETMVMFGDVDLPLVAIREQIDAGIDLVVHLQRDRDGRRSIIEVCELVGGDQRLATVADASGAVIAPTRPARAPGTAAIDDRWLC